MSKRFKIIETYIKKYSGGTAPTTGPIAEYLKVKSGTYKPSYAAGTWPDKKGLKQVGVTSFLKAGTVYMTSMTNRVVEETAVAPLVTAATHLTAEEAVPPPKGWKPARITAKLTSYATAPKTSEITKLSYEKPTTSESYTIPFGKNTATDTFMDRVGVISAALPVDGTNDGWTIDFKAEMV